MSSLDKIYSGTSKEFVHELEVEVLSHPVLKHPFLVTLANGGFNNTDDVIRDYAHQYSFYSRWFPEYVKSVMATTDDENVLQPLQENLDEELGTAEDDDNNIPHTELFKTFKSDIGIDKSFEDKNEMCLTVGTWRELFLQKCKSKNTAIGVGAISLATEFIVPHFYPFIIDGIEKHSSFDNSSSFFFRLHVECDEEHAREAIEVAKYLCDTPENREAIRFGVFSSLSLRHAFFDNQLARANAI